MTNPKIKITAAGFWVMKACAARHAVARSSSLSSSRSPIEPDEKIFACHCREGDPIGAATRWPQRQEGPPGLGGLCH